MDHIMVNSRKIFLLSVIAFVVACQGQIERVDYSSENLISFRYKDFSSSPVVTSEVRGQASEHCKKYGKVSEYQGVEMIISDTEEVHTFSCKK